MKNKKPYTWEEIKDFLIKELKKTKHIMTFGTIGSCNVEHDIDIIITKKPTSSSSEFFKELHNILDLLNSYLKKKYNANLIRVPNTSYTLEFMRLSNYSKNDLVLHTLVYNSYPLIEKDWNWAMFENEDVENILSESDFLLGSFRDLISEKFKKSNYADNLFLYLNIYDRTNSNYSNTFLLKIMNYYLNFLFNKRLSLKTPTIKSKKDVREAIYKLGDIN